MPEAWIQLHCPACEKHWEANPADVPAPTEKFQCPHCGAQRPIREFMRAERDLDVLKEFHSE